MSQCGNDYTDQHEKREIKNGIDLKGKGNGRWAWAREWSREWETGDSCSTAGQFIDASVRIKILLKKVRVETNKVGIVMITCVVKVSR